MIEILPKNAEYQEPITICSNDINNFEHAIFMKQLHEIENLKPGRFASKGFFGNLLFFIEYEQEYQDKRIHEIYLDDSLQRPVGFYDLKDIDYENHSVCYEISFLKNANFPENYDLNKLDFHFKEKKILDLGFFEKRSVINEFTDCSFFGSLKKSNAFEYYISKKMVLDQKA